MPRVRSPASGPGRAPKARRGCRDRRFGHGRLGLLERGDGLWERNADRVVCPRPEM